MLLLKIEHADKQIHYHQNIAKYKTFLNTLRHLLTCTLLVCFDVFKFRQLFCILDSFKRITTLRRRSLRITNNADTEYERRGSFGT